MSTPSGNNDKSSIIWGLINSALSGLIGVVLTLALSSNKNQDPQVSVKQYQDLFEKYTERRVLGDGIQNKRN